MELPKATHKDIELAAAGLAELLVEAITEKYAKKRKKAKPLESPSELSSSN